MSDTVTFAFKTFQSVRIKAVEADGFVFSRMCNSQDENEYKVSFWLDSKRQQDWFYEFELEPKP